MGSWSLPTAVSVDETCILGVSQEGEKKSYPLLLKVSFKVAQVLAVHFWMIKMYMENIFNAIYHKCCFACLWMHQCKFGFQCFHAAFHRLLNMRCGSNVNVFFLSHFSVLFLLSYIAILTDTYRYLFATFCASRKGLMTAANWSDQVRIRKITPIKILGRWGDIFYKRRCTESAISCR